jgi:hypothetical protein
MGLGLPLETAQPGESSLRETSALQRLAHLSASQKQKLWGLNALRAFGAAGRDE